MLQEKIENWGGGLGHCEKINTFTVEGKTYWVRESYIINGTGYTFGIWTSRNFKKPAQCIYSVDLGRVYVLVGKKKNYLLKRNDKTFASYTDDLTFTQEEYEKFDLGFVLEKDIFWIHLKGERLVGFYSSFKKERRFISNEIQLSKYILRKKKLEKINSL